MTAQPAGDLEFCTGCGRAGDDCPGCARPLDPPRFCARCGRRMAVLVTPTGYAARCRDHGPEATG